VRKAPDAGGERRDQRSRVHGSGHGGRSIRSLP
jgi:hypothetical protein